MEHVHGLNHVHVIAVAVQQAQRRHRRVAERHLVAVGRMVRGRIRVRLGIIIRAGRVMRVLGCLGKKLTAISHVL